MVTLPPDLYDTFQVALEGTTVRPTLAYALIERESGWNPDAVGDTTWTRTQILNAFRTGGLAAARASGASLGLGQINAVHWTDTLNPEALFSPSVNLVFALALLNRHLRAAAGDERDALRRYNGVLPVGTPRYLERERTYVDPIMARAAALGAEGIRREGGQPPPGAPPLAPAAPAPPAAGAVTITLTGIQLKAVAAAQVVLRKILQTARTTAGGGVLPA